MSENQMVNILDFSDDVLLHILSHLSSWDILSVISTCQRLNKVGKDHSLWKKADFSDGILNASDIVRKVLPCLHKCTKLLHIRGRKRKSVCIHKWRFNLLSQNICKTIGWKCPNLKELIISESVINAEKFKVIHLGEIKSITSLCIRNCEFLNLPSPVSEGSYFKNINNIFPHIENLEISYCNWITDYDLMILSKLDSLRKLSLRCNLRIGFTIAYLSISFRFGFKNLEHLDLRGTSLQSGDVPCIMQCKKLKSLSIGPIDRVRRLNQCVDDGLNLIISDPHRRDEPRQKVVVINMGPNGPDWRQAEDEELETLGLQWLKNGLNRHREASSKEDEHYFFCKEGKILKENPDNKAGESSQTSKASRKRKEGCCKGRNASKRSRSENTKEINQDYDSSDEEEEREEDRSSQSSETSQNYPLIDYEENDIPDELLGDALIHAFKNHSDNLEKIQLAGCYITNDGLRDLLNFAPALKYVDITNTLVKEKFVQDIQILYPNCDIVLNNYSVQYSR